MKKITLTFCFFIFFIWQINGQLIADFKAADTLGCATLIVNFIDQSTSDSSTIVSWEWDLGDGTTANTPTLVHIYDEVGNYTVCLTITDDLGNSATVCKQDFISINFQPVIDFTGSETFIQLTCNGNDPLTGPFTLNASNSLTSPNTIFEWFTPDDSLLSNEPIIQVDTVLYYKLILRDTLTNCSDAKIILWFINQPLSPYVFVDYDNHQIDCQNPEITLDADVFPSENIIFEWTTTNGNILTSPDSLEITVNQPGFYSIIATDTLTGCAGGNGIHVNKIGPLTINSSYEIFVCDSSAINYNATFNIFGNYEINIFDPLGDTICHNLSCFFPPQTGLYFIEALEINSGCFLRDSFMVHVPAPLEINVDSIQCVSEIGNDGFIEINVSGGFPPYDFIWINVSTDQNIYNLDPSAYALALDDSLGCSLFETFEVELCEEVVSTQELDKYFHIFPNPTQGEIFIQNIGSPIQNIQLFSSDGNLLLEKNNNFESIEFLHLSEGIFILQIQNEEGVFTKKILQHK